MGEPLDALYTLYAGVAAPDEPKSTVDQAVKTFQGGSRRIGEAVEAARQPDTALDIQIGSASSAPVARHCVRSWCDGG
jgi:hypothetical protein